MINAARAGNLSVVTTLLSTCAPQSAVPEERDEEDPALHELSKVMVGERALMQAINGGFKEVVIYLLNNGVSINNPLPWRLFDLDQDHSQDSILTIPRLVEMGCFALHLAIAHKDQAMVRLLLEADADPDLGIYYFEKERYVNCKWKSPLAHACALGNSGIARDLLEYGANIESQYTSCTTWKELHFRYSTPLIQAARSGHVPTMGLLLEAGADANNYDYAGVTPLAAAAAGSVSYIPAYPKPS
jgi:ankyrin repeat protein